MNRTILKSGILFALASVALIASLKAQDLPPGFPREGSTKVLENSRVIVWDATWPKGKATALHEHSVDYLSVTLVEGTVKLTQRDGTSSVATAQFGSVRFNRKGVIHAEEGISDQERRAIMVELKTVPRPAEAAVTRSGFPRDGATKGLENERVAVWDVTWIQGQQIPRRQQGRDAVVVFLKCHSAISGGSGGKRHAAECRRCSVCFGGY
jgi:hypothetical protein